MLGPGNVDGQFESTFCPLCGAEDRETILQGVKDRLLGHPGTFDIHQCAQCAVRYLDPRPVGETLLQYYSARDSEEYPDNQERRIKRLSPAERWWLCDHAGYPEPKEPRPSARRLQRGGRSLASDRDRWRFLPFHPPGRLLDIGCGSGAYLAMMRELGWSVQGTNVVASAAMDVERRLGIPCRVGEVSELGFSRASFEAITLWHVLEHLTDPRETLRILRSLLVPGGLLAVGVPVYDCVESERLGDAWLGYEVPRHLVTFSRARLRSFLSECGFQVERVESEMRDRVLKISYARSHAKGVWKAIMRKGLLRRWYARLLVRRNEIGTVVAIARAT